MKKLITESLEYPNGAMYEEVYKAAKRNRMFQHMSFRAGRRNTVIL